MIKAVIVLFFTDFSGQVLATDRLILEPKFKTYAACYNYSQQWYITNRHKEEKLNGKKSVGYIAKCDKLDSI